VHIAAKTLSTAFEEKFEEFEQWLAANGPEEEDEYLPAAEQHQQHHARSLPPPPVTAAASSRWVPALPALSEARDSSRRLVSCAERLPKKEPKKPKAQKRPRAPTDGGAMAEEMDNPTYQQLTEMRKRMEQMQETIATLAQNTIQQKLAIASTDHVRTLRPRPARSP
jgi:hypothetical protein